MSRENTVDGTFNQTFTVIACFCQVMELFLGAGITVSSFCYLQFFPPPYDIDGTFFFIN